MFDLEIVEAQDPQRTAQVAALLRDYKLWLSRRYVKDFDELSPYFDPREWASELADLQGHYGAPHGAIVLALVDGVPAGCVMLRGIGLDVCEMKRLFVRPAFQGMGIARAMIRRLAALAVLRGYKTLRLETGYRQREAQALYTAVGFKRIAPYYEVNGWLKDHLLFYEADPRCLAKLPATRPRCELAAA